MELKETMQQYAIHTLINNGTVNLDFVEKQYCLADHEVLMGRSNSFPVKQNIGGLVDFQRHQLTGAITDRAEFSIKPTSPYSFNLGDWISEKYPQDSGVDNAGINITADVIYYFNHYYYDRSVPVTKHFSGSAQKKIAFTVYRPKKLGEAYAFCNAANIHFTGAWLEYDSATAPYYSITNRGVVVAEAFPVALVQGLMSTQLFLQFDNNLRSQSGFSALPDYMVEVKLRMLSYEFSKDNHSIEIL